jgi:hypothetical protein
MKLVLELEQQQVIELRYFTISITIVKPLVVEAIDLHALQ